MNDVAGSRRLPAITRASYARELRTWSLLAIAVAVVEGAVAAVILKNVFSEVVARAPLNFMMALVSGAGMYSNLLSFTWASVSHGRRKVKLVVWLQASLAICLVAVAMAPLSFPGLLMFSLAVIAARFVWSGVVTVRSAIWRANYARDARATLAGGFLTAHALLGGATALGLGFLLECEPRFFRLAYPLAALAALLGAFWYRKLRVQQQGTLLASERALGSGTTRPALSDLVDILRSDRAYRLYLVCMFIFGGGNLMIIAPTIAVLSDGMMLGQRDQMLITAALPMLLTPLAVPFWARILNKRHVVAFRALHAWSFVLGNGLLAAGAILGTMSLLWAGAAAMGFAYAGGELGWNLGHNDFASEGRGTQYMGLHMMLTGVRGFLAPLLGISAYQLAEFARPGAGRFALLLPWSFTVLGAFGFVLLNRWLRRQPQAI